MGDFVKKSTDIDVLATAAVIGSFALGGPVVGLLAAGTVATVGAQRQAAGAQEVELELAQRKESQAANDREIQRKRRLAAVLGSQSAEAAARGLSMSGSVANISLTDAQRAGEESFVDNINTRARIDALKRNRRTISRVSNFRTATTILGAAERQAVRG